METLKIQYSVKRCLSMIRRSLLGLLVPLSIVMIPHPGSGAELADPKVVKIGMVELHLYRCPSRPDRLSRAQFAALVKDRSGINGEMISHLDAFDLAQHLTQEKVHFGVFHGIEFAWVQKKYPTLKPLIVTVYKNRLLNAQLVVRDDSEAGKFADLKGKDLGLHKTASSIAGCSWNATARKSANATPSNSSARC